MAVHVLITTDTEMSSSLHEEGVSASDNFRLTIEGRCDDGSAWGVGHQMDRLEAAGLQGVFFVDPMPGLIYGRQIVADMVGPIVARGHEVQLHIHTEWLAYAGETPVGAARGNNIGDFARSDQIALLGLARDMLVEAGAPPPSAFRAGNYGANDETLAALAALGLRYDSSFNPAYAERSCAISLPADQQHVTQAEGIALVPVSAIEDQSGRLRPAQICALSAREMESALDNALAQRAEFFNIVSHSFELIVREHRLPHPIMIARFDRLCDKIAGEGRLKTAGFADMDGVRQAAQPLASDRMRQIGRIGEQVMSRILYEGAGPVPPVAPLLGPKSAT